MTDDDLLQPEDFGLVALPIAVPPMLEEALGYPGEERYVVFHEWRPDRLGFFVADGQGFWQGSSPGWSLFLSHPAVTCICQRAELDFHRTAPAIPTQQFLASPEADRKQFWRGSRCLVLDRNARRLYVARADNATFFVTTNDVPQMPDLDDDGNTDEVSFAEAADDEFGPPHVDSRPPVAVARHTLKAMRFWLDHHDASFQLNRSGTAPSAMESSGLQPIPLRVGDGILEAAFGYDGNARYVSFHWSPEQRRIFVCGGIGDVHYSAAAEEWREFLNHPMVIPRLRPRSADAATIDFSARIGPLSDSTLFADEEVARRMEAHVVTSCLLLDRATNDLYLGPWSGAILFHSLMGPVPLEEDLAEKLPTANVLSLSRWLADHDDNVQRILATASAYSQSGEKDKALELLRRCLELAPGSHAAWFHLTHVYADMRDWTRAVEACEEAIKSHPVAGRKYVSVEMLFKWRANFLLSAKRYADSIDALKLLFEIDPLADSATIHCQLARCQTALGANDDAVLAREEVVKCRRESLQRNLSYKRPRTEFVTNEDEPDDEEFDREFLDDLRQEMGDAWRDLGRAYRAAGRFDQSEWAYRQAIDASPAPAKARAELGVLLQFLGRGADAGSVLAGALSDARERAQREGFNGVAHLDLAFVYKAIGNESEADTSLKHAAAAGIEPSPEEFTFLAKVASVPQGE